MLMPFHKWQLIFLFIIVLLDGTFYMWDGSIRYKYLFYRNGMYVFMDFTNKRKKFEVSEAELAGWLRI